MTQERRRLPRIGCVLPVRLYSSEQPNVPKVIETLTKDLGSGGLRCLSPSEHTVSSPISLEITLGPGEKPLSLRAQIVWVETVPHSQQFYLGLAFHHLSDADTKRLSRYVEKISSHLSPSNAS